MPDVSAVLFLGWIAWSIINAQVAKEKGRSAGGILVLSIFLSPLLGYSYILAVPSLKGVSWDRVCALLQEIRNELREE